MTEHEQAGEGPKLYTSELIQRAAERLQLRLGRTVRDLQIHAHEDGVVLSGRANTYYAKQLAQHLAIEIFGNDSVANKIHVH